MAIADGWARFQAGEFDLALLAGGSGPARSAQHSAMAQSVFPPDDATWQKKAKVAMSRRLAVRLCWMMRKKWDYQQVVKFGSHAEQPGNRRGVNPTPRY